MRVLLLLKRCLARPQKIARDVDIPSLSADRQGGGAPWHGPCSSTGMRNETNLLEPEPRGARHGEATTRIFWKPALPEAVEPLPVPRPRAGHQVPYLLAPYPWPRGQFRIDPEE